MPPTPPRSHPRCAALLPELPHTAVPPTPGTELIAMVLLAVAAMVLLRKVL